MQVFSMGNDNYTVYITDEEIAKLAIAIKQVNYLISTNHIIDNYHIKDSLLDLAENIANESGFYNF